jgi:hypothetical protein
MSSSAPLARQLRPEDPEGTGSLLGRGLLRDEPELSLELVCHLPINLPLAVVSIGERLEHVEAHHDLIELPGVDTRPGLAAPPPVA